MTEAPRLGRIHGEASQVRCSTYISYDDEQSIAEKGAYVKAKGLGGVIQWELNEGYLKSAAAGERNPLLKAIAASVLQ
jgi:chitinase